MDFERKNMYSYTNRNLVQVVKKYLLNKIFKSELRQGTGTGTDLDSGGSVADPGCLSRIPDPDFYPSRIPGLGSRIPDPKTATKERGEKNLLL